MATIKESYQKAIENAFIAANSLIDNYQKSIAYATIAQALAQTGLIGDEDKSETDNKKTQLNTENKIEELAKKNEKPQIITREDLKRKPKSDTIEKTDEKDVVQQDNNEISSGDNSKDADKEEWEPDSAEWTEEAQKHLSAELDFIAGKAEEYGEDSINECVKGFSSGTIKEWTDLNPLNIRAFTFYLKALEKDAEAEKMEMPY